MTSLPVRSAHRRISARFSPQQLSLRLLLLAGIFLFVHAAILTLAPAARARTWQVDYRWSHWLGFLVWCLVFGLAERTVRRRLPDADPYLLPLAALLSGWGLLTIYRLEPAFGLRQTLWLAVCGAAIQLGLRLSAELGFLRRYKYIWLTGGLLLTALTLVFGTNPNGGGPRLWLGCCGLYFQPSEPLKLLFIVYLAAYLSGRLPFIAKAWQLLVPTAVLMGVALLLLVVQRDLGTASIFIVLYTIILFVASGKKRLLLISLVGLAVAGFAGYFLFDVVRLRVDAWIDPWLDPSGRSFQIVQSLMAVANGGTFGRGPGLGNPGLVPVAISDFIYTSIAEETGLTGSLALLGLIGFLTLRSLHVAMRAPDNFRRLLAAGLAVYLGVQSILIIGGNIRLLPLTGVTLPFVSYGGSSLLTSILGLVILLLISNQPENEPAIMAQSFPFSLLSSGLLLGLLALALTSGWWAIARGPDLLERTDNARRTIADRFVKRGSLLDRNETAINVTQGQPGGFQRLYLYPELGPVAGYTDPVYGQSGLEAALDPYLRGLQGNPASTLWWDHLVYGQPPPGLDVRLSLDLELQARADALLQGRVGAAILLNASSGELLVMSSHPNFDPKNLETMANSLFSDPRSPLLDRAAQGLYPPGELLNLFLRTAGYERVPSAAVAEDWYSVLGFYTAPAVRLHVAMASSPGETLLVSPLQVALAAAALSNGGIRPAPRLAMAVNTPLQGWVILPALGQPVTVFSPTQVKQTTDALLVNGESFWSWNGVSASGGSAAVWAVGGTFSDWQGTPLTAVVLLEQDDRQGAAAIVKSLLEQATQP
jgi:cell division protein FtsW (lipid II flippase)